MKKTIDWQRTIATACGLLAGVCLAMTCGIGFSSAAAENGAFQPPPTNPAADPDAIAKAREAVRQKTAELAQQEAAAPATNPPADSPSAPAPPAPPTNPPPGAPQVATAPPPVKPAANPNPSGPESTAGKTLYSFQASDLELKAALAQFARANNLNVVPDNDVTGAVTLDVRDLPLDVMMRALLEASDCSWHEEGGLIRVRNTDTRTFIVDYLRLSRKGIGHSSAMLNSATAGGSSGGSSGGGGGAGGGSGGGGGVGTGGSQVNLTADNPIDFWKELKDELGYILTTEGRSTLSINMTAGILQITDRPSALKRAESYLSGVDKSIHRQVDLEAKIYDVELNDQFQFGIDWVHVAEAYGGALAFGGATLPIANGGGTLGDSTLGGLNRLVGQGFGGSQHSLVFTNFNTAAAVNALKQQGNVEVISKPRIRTLNNQTALIKVGTETPFFAQSFQANQSQSGNQTFSGDQITTITVGTILSITPQVSDDDWVSLDISPVLSSLVGTETSPSKTATAPILDTKQASTLVRVRDGVTVVLGGLIQTSHARNDKKIPVLGDIPGLGKLFTGTFRYKQKKELVIFITPYIVRDNEPSVSTHVEKDTKFFSHF